MARIVVAGASDGARAQVERLLAASGYGVFRTCASGGELRRALSTCGDGVVVIAGRVPDCCVDELAADFEDRFRFLLIGRPQALSGCESPGVFRLAYPCAGGAVVGAVEMLTQLHAMRLPRRADDERQLVERAKAFLMRKYRIPEPEAHRRMQAYAMRHGIRMTRYAAELLREAGETEEI